ncbi:MAG: HAMP domain-containing histidine kinase [Proteobacteria bacterium]|nr:HAMP domain-containing histidine kinase [Pseudomonadota bacterium]
MNQYIKINLYSLLLFFISLCPLFTFHLPQNQIHNPHETDIFYYVDFEGKTPLLKENVSPIIYQKNLKDLAYKLKAFLETSQGQFQFFILFCFMFCIMQSFLGFLIPKKLSNLWNVFNKNVFELFLSHFINNFSSQKIFRPQTVSYFSEKDTLIIGKLFSKNILAKTFKKNKTYSDSLEKTSLKKVLFEIQKSYSKELKDQKIAFSIQGSDEIVKCREGVVYYIFYIIFKAILKRTLPHAKITIRLKKVSDLLFLTIIDTGLLFSQDRLKYLSSLTGQKSNDDIVEKDQKNLLNLTQRLGWKISYGIKNNLNVTKILIKKISAEKENMS